MSGWLVQMLVSTSLLMAVVLVARKPVAQLFGAKAAYALWLAPALRAVMPPLPAAPVVPAVSNRAADYLIVTGNAVQPGIPAATILGVVWAAGAIAFLTFHWLQHRRFLAAALAGGRALDISGIRQRVVASRAIHGPMATGLVCPVILVPEDFARRFTPAEQRFALLHEQLHHRRGDIWASAAALVIASLHWLNPLAYLALAAFRRDMEAACDASVIGHTGRDCAPDYARTILRCAASPAPRSLCALTSLDELKGRLSMLKLNHGASRRAAGIALATMVAVAGLATAGIAKDKPKPATHSETIEKRIVIRNGDGKGTTEFYKHSDDDSLAGAKCSGEKFEASANGGTANKKQQVKLVLCAGKGDSMLEALQKAETDLSRRNEMPAQTKNEILGQIRAKIAELRSKG